MPNIVIIGSGPAGVSAALYTARAGVETTVLTKGPGALDRAAHIQNYYGFAAPISGGNCAVSGAPLVRRVTLFTNGRRACTSCRAYSPLPSTATSFPR